ncbi:MAG: tRNA 2-selenouridine(34) synthase MnmH [Bacteroidota bacterium]
MAIEKIDIETFLTLSKSIPVFDVRSPAEYTHAHIPDAISLPLFSDEERKVVGTLYKQKSRQDAIKAGLDFFGVKMRLMVEEVEAYFKKKNRMGDDAETPALIVHCWRGGMRSAGVAWLLDLYGFKVYTLIGGYKSYRKWALAQFEKTYAIKVLGGYTGSGKTEIIQEFIKQKIPAIDLEALAGHRGSAFGNIGLPKQPSQEYFENQLALSLYQANEHAINKSESIWLEDESQRLGDVNIPKVFWDQMRSTKLYFLDLPFEERLIHTIKLYGKLDKMKMIGAIIRIKKRLGGLEAKEAVSAFMEDRLEDCFRILLKYYDKHYQKGMETRENLSENQIRIICESLDVNNITLVMKEAGITMPNNQSSHTTL